MSDKCGDLCIPLQNVHESTAKKSNPNRIGILATDRNKLLKFSGAGSLAIL